MLDFFLHKLTSPRPVSCLQHPPFQAVLRTSHGRTLRLCLIPSLCEHVSAPSMACLCFFLQIRCIQKQAKRQKQDGAWRGPGGFESFIQYHMIREKKKKEKEIYHWQRNVFLFQWQSYYFYNPKGVFPQLPCLRHSHYIITAT